MMGIKMGAGRLSFLLTLPLMLAGLAAFGCSSTESARQWYRRRGRSGGPWRGRPGPLRQLVRALRVVLLVWKVLTRAHL